MSVDLHCHSAASDGSDPPAELVAKASSLGLSALALTDHDTFAGLEEAEEEARARNLYFIRGCEVSALSDLGEIHLLGLWLPRKCDLLDRLFAHMRANRLKRNEEMLARLNSLGVRVSAEDLASSTTRSPGRPHVARAMVRKGYVKSVEEAFQKYLGKGGLAYVPRVAPTPAQATRLLVELGAAVSLAHPYLRLQNIETIENFSRELAKSGLTAIEAWHSSHSEEQTRALLRVADRLGLAVSGGSDYHGANKPGIELASGRGGVNVPDEALKNLVALRKKNGLPCEDF